MYKDSIENITVIISSRSILTNEKRVDSFSGKKSKVKRYKTSPGEKELNEKISF